MIYTISCVHGRSSVSEFLWSDEMSVWVGFPQTLQIFLQSSMTVSLIKYPIRNILLNRSANVDFKLLDNSKKSTNLVQFSGKISKIP